jgi:hypothetical protein
MKIGRREHLRQLGFGAAGILGAGLSDLSLGRTLNPIALPKLKAREWPWTKSVPPDENPGIRLIFAGMMVFSYKGRQARVVFHTGSQHHKLEVIAYEVGTPCIEKLRRTGPEVPKKIEIISPNGHSDDVEFFQTSDPDDFNRKNWDCKDFRWLLDLEGPETFGNRNHGRIESKGFNKKLHVSSGCFYTFLRSTSTFKTDVGSLSCQEFNVARIMACDIKLEETQVFKLNVGGKDLTMQNPARYEIYFLNTCDSCTTSDFPMVFDAVENGDIYKFDLTLAGKTVRCPIPPTCFPIITRTSDEAPCMGGGFGGGKGFP